MFSNYDDICMTPIAKKKLEEYLTYHEEDIAIGINDFDDLREVFECIIGKPATYENIA